MREAGPMADDEFHYASGFGNEFTSEAVEGALPNSSAAPRSPSPAR
jgi:homogentisate 1,2-dioxygenase